MEKFKGSEYFFKPLYKGVCDCNMSKQKEYTFVRYCIQPKKSGNEAQMKIKTQSQTIDSLYWSITKSPNP